MLLPTPRYMSSHERFRRGRTFVPRFFVKAEARAEDRIQFGLIELRHGVQQLQMRQEDRCSWLRLALHEGDVSLICR